MHRRLLILGIGLTISLACTKGDARAEAAAPADKGTPTATAPSAKTNPGPADAKPAPATNTSAANKDALAPFAEGKRVRITKLYETKPIEALVPADVKVKMSHLNDDDILPRANLVGGTLNLEVMAPEGGFVSLADELKMRSPKQTFLRSYEDEGGYVLIWKSEKTASGTVFGTLVSRPRLKVTCRQSDMPSLEDAERAASVCLTLRPVTR
jgi:hypothetical protein